MIDPEFFDEPWRDWFAWHPVRLRDTDRLVWFRWVQRRYNWPFADLTSLSASYTEYRSALK